MRCQGRIGKCQNQAMFVRDVPDIGESLCFCADCVNDCIARYFKDFGWQVMTPERERIEDVSHDMVQIWSGSFFPKK